MNLKSHSQIILFTVQILFFFIALILLLLYIVNLPRKILRDGQVIILPTSKTELYIAISLTSFGCLLALFQKYFIKINYSKTSSAIIPLSFLLQVGLIAWILFYIVQDTSGCPGDQTYNSNLNICQYKR